jgi:ATP-binding cassette, subfamily C (CFTR/MRP), member 4
VSCVCERVCELTDCAHAKVVGTLFSTLLITVFVCSKDTASIDDVCPLLLIECNIFTAMFVAVVCLAVAIVPFLAVIVVLVSLLMFGLRTLVIRTARDVKRLESLHRSPLFAHVFNTLGGLPVIRSEAEAVHKFRQTFDVLQDRHAKASVANDALSRWMAVHAEIPVFLLATATAFAVVYFRSTLSAASTALVLIHALSLADMTQWMMRLTVDLEIQLTSCERVLEYSSLPTEEVRACACVNLHIDGSISLTLSLSLFFSPLADCGQVRPRSFWRFSRAR